MLSVFKSRLFTAMTVCSPKTNGCYSVTAKQVLLLIVTDCICLCLKTTTDDSFVCFVLFFICLIGRICFGLVASQWAVT